MSLKKKILISVFVPCVILVTSVFFLRNYFLEKKLDSVAASFHTKTGGTLIISEKKFNGIKKVELNNIVVLSPVADTVIKVDSVVAGISIWKLIRLKSPLMSLIVKNVSVHLKKDTLNSNYSFLFNRKAKKNSVSSNEKNYAAQCQMLWDNLMDLSTRRLSVSNTQVVFISPDYKKFIKVPLMLADKGLLSFDVEDHTGYTKNKWIVTAALDKTQDAADFKIISANETGNAWFPFFDIDKKPKLSCRFFDFKIQKEESNNTDFKFRFSSLTNSLSIDYYRLASDMVTFDNLAHNFLITVSKSYAQVDSTSWFNINKIKVNFYSRINRAAYNKISLKLFFELPSQDFFASLPKGMFTLFDGIKTKGKLIYHLAFAVDMANVDSLVFDSELKGSGLGISRYGKEYFAKIDSSFLFDAYDGERYVKSFLVGKGSTSFTPLADISHYLQYAVLTSEDPSFFYHRGFIQDAFRESIIENIKAKRFVRGGSTISMQLVKNVFLTREKTVSRKLQEALIVWFIENFRLVSKERMFEIYLNIIEWGPGIYGIKDAAHFYFNKTPLQLTLAESIYLASIIPRPKHFKYSFDKQGNLKPYLSGYFKLVSTRMLSKTWITPLDTLGLQPAVQLKGDALKFVIPVDTIPADTTIIEADDFLN